MYKKFLATAGFANLVALWGCGYQERRSYDFYEGVYSGTVSLLAGATPGCSSVADPAVDACCDDVQYAALAVSLYADGYYAAGWPASIDATGRLYWQESTNSSDGDCAIFVSTEETMTQSYVYSYAATTTQTCTTSVQSLLCAYSGQLRLQ